LSITTVAAKNDGSRPYDDACARHAFVITDSTPS
jgi:hypothetical protein